MNRYLISLFCSILLASIAAQASGNTSERFENQCLKSANHHLKKLIELEAKTDEVCFLSDYLQCTNDMVSNMIQSENSNLLPLCKSICDHEYGILTCRSDIDKKTSRRASISLAYFYDLMNESKKADFLYKSVKQPDIVFIHHKSRCKIDFFQTNQAFISNYLNNPNTRNWANRAQIVCLSSRKKLFAQQRFCKELENLAHEFETNTPVTSTVHTTNHWDQNQQ